jgi:hypothetical protein
MKRICYAVSVLLFISWVSIYFILHAGFGSHALILLAIIFWMQAIIVTAPKKIPDEIK